MIIEHIYREVNMAADWLAKYGHSVSGTMLATDFCNPEFRIITTKLTVDFDRKHRILTKIEHFDRIFDRKSSVGKTLVEIIF